MRLFTNFAPHPCLLLIVQAVQHGEPLAGVEGGEGGEDEQQQQATAAEHPRRGGHPRGFTGRQQVKMSPILTLFKHLPT